MRESASIVEIWVYLSGSPLIALFITLAAYQIGLWLYQRSAQNPIANPVAIAVILVSVAIELLQMPYRTYFEGAQFVHFLLGSATVSLAIPIYRGIQHLQSRALPLIISLVCGGLVSILSAVGIATALGADQTLVGGLYSKSVTAPDCYGYRRTNWYLTHTHCRICGGDWHSGCNLGTLHLGCTGDELVVAARLCHWGCIPRHWRLACL